MCILLYCVIHIHTHAYMKTHSLTHSHTKHSRTHTHTHQHTNNTYTQKKSLIHLQELLGHLLYNKEFLTHTTHSRAQLLSATISLAVTVGTLHHIILGVKSLLSVHTHTHTPSLSHTHTPVDVRVPQFFENILKECAHSSVELGTPAGDVCKGVCVCDMYMCVCVYVICIYVCVCM